MTRTLLGFVAALLVAAAAAAQQSAPVVAPKPTEGPKPVIDIVDKIKDFGTVPKGEKIHADFTVRNTGTAPLEISQVRPTCGCTVADFDHTIPPGGSGKIDAEVDTTGFSGPISKALLVFSNDPGAPQVNLVIKADVRAFIEVLPRPLIIFRNVLQGEAATEKLILVSADGSNFKIEGASASSGPYKLDYHELAEKERVPDHPGSQWQLDVTVPPDAAEGMLNQKILVKTTSPKAPEVTINVTGVVRPVVQVIPGEINFGTVPGDALVGRNLLVINNRQGSELQLTDVSVDNTNFSAEVIPLQAGQRYQVAVSMKAGVPKGEQKGTLKISTSDAMRKVIEVPVVAMVQ
jgi:hypothetical protein